MHRFFIPTEWIRYPLVHIQGETARQITRVLRLECGSVITILDDSSIERTVRLTLVECERVDGEIIAESNPNTEPKTKVSLYIVLTQRAKFEWILQKCTELGVATFIPLITSRSLVRETSGDSRKGERWQGIIREAAEQSGRASIPQILPVMPFTQALEHGIKDNDICLVAWEKETSRCLRNCLQPQSAESKAPCVAALVGPEGGLSETEARLAIEYGWIPISLGPRILRMETAAITLTALILHELGDLNPPSGVAAGS